VSDERPRIRSARGPGAAEASSLADRIKVDREQGRIRVTLTRRYSRVFYLGDDEADYLRGQLGNVVAPVTITRVEDRKAGQ
jgi:hypothetical protein